MPGTKKRTLISIAVWAVVLAAFVIVGHKHFGDLGKLAAASPPWVAANVLLFLLIRFLNGEVMHAGLGQLGHPMGRVEAFLLNMVMGYTNLVVPHAGMGPPALYLKVRHGVEYSRLAALLLPMTVLQTLLAGLFGLGAVAWAACGEATWRQQAPMALLFAAVAVGSAAIIFLPLRVPGSWQGRIGRGLLRFHEAWIDLRSNPRFVGRILVLQGAVILLRAVRMHTAFLAVGLDSSFPAAFIASLCGQFMLFISITPGALGFREAAIGYVMYRFTEGQEVALSASVLDRVVMTVVIVIVAQIGIFKLIRPALRGSGGKGSSGEAGDGENSPTR